MIPLYACESCTRPTRVSHDPELVLCESCHVEALLSDAADAVDANGERLDIEYRALCMADSDALDGGAS